MARSAHPSPRRHRGQILPIAVIAILVVIAGAALVLEGGNAYAQQRGSQNAADAAANAGAAVLAQRFDDPSLDTNAVDAAVDASATANAVTAWTAYYTNRQGQIIDGSGSASPRTSAAVVGVDAIPPGAQGVTVDADRTFDAFIGRAIGFDSFKASATATAITGRLTGGTFLPVVFPINITDCEGNGSVGAQETDGEWLLSQPPATPGGRPVGTEYIVPLCKTGSGSFQILDFDPGMKCEAEVREGVSVTLTLPTDVDSDNGNDCASKIVDEVNALHGQVVFIPVCDNASGGEAIGQCQTKGGSKATYHIVKVAAFWVDYMADSNNANKPDAKCQSLPGGPTALPGTDIDGNGSSSCLAGYFVRYITAGTVDQSAAPDGDNDAIGIQLIK